jgi:hypothetical protein
MPRLFDIEHAQHFGVDNLRRRASAVSVLSTSTRGELDSSVYFQDVLRPAGMADEMRVVLKHGSRTRGLLCWCRGPGPRFSPPTTSPWPVRWPARRPRRYVPGCCWQAKTPGRCLTPPGVLIVEDRQLALATSIAQTWLADLPEDHRPGRAGDGLPYAVTALLAGAGTDHTQPALTNPGGDPLRALGRAAGLGHRTGPVCGRDRPAAAPAHTRGMSAGSGMAAMIPRSRR